MSEIQPVNFNFKLLRQIWLFSKPQHKMLWFAFIITLILAALAPVRPYLAQVAIDSFDAGKQTLLFYTVLMLVILVLQAVLQFAFTFFANVIAQDVIRDLRTQVFKSVASF
jgi:ATP-binding cassette subfamily B multidrug efflux pump